MAATMNLAILPNALTVIRGLLAIGVIANLLLGQPVIAFKLFILAGVTDSLDGYLARRFGWISRFGSIADPIADKFLVVSSFMALAWLGAIPIWVAVVIVVRDIWIVLGATYYHFFIGVYALKPTLISKLNTFMQLVFIFCQIFELAFHLLPRLMILSVQTIMVCTTIYTMLDYTWVWGKKALIHRRLKHEQQR